MKLWISTIVVLLGVVFAGSARAASCTISSISGVSFGGYNIFSAVPLDSVGSITYRCDDVGVADTILIQLSRGNASSYAPRTLLQGSYELDYNLYLDAARTTIWGDGTDGSSQYGPVNPPNATQTTVNVYGRIPAGQNARAGAYSDTVIVTFVF